MNSSVIIDPKLLYRHATEAEWETNPDFIPSLDERIVYDIDENHDTTRSKTGDGVTPVKDLPFDPVCDNKKNHSVVMNNPESNKVLGQYGIAGGKSSVSGCKGIYIHSIEYFTDENGKMTDGTICLSVHTEYSDNSRPAPVITDMTDGTKPSTLVRYVDSPIKFDESVIGKEVGIILAASHLFQGAVIESTSYNLVRFTGDLGFNESVNVGSGDPDEGIFIIPEMPEIGKFVFYLGGFAFGSGATAIGVGAVAFGADVIAYKCAAAFGFSNKANAYSFVAGQGNNAVGMFSTVFGQGNKVYGRGGFSSGVNNISIGQGAFAEGESTKALAYRAHAAGFGTIASGTNSLALGDSSEASGDNAFSGGYNSKATKFNSFAFGNSVQATGLAAFATGIGTLASGDYSFAGGIGTVASGYGGSVVGKYNDDTIPTYFAVGYGTDDEHRANAFSVLRDGTAEVASQGTKKNSIVLYKTFNEKTNGIQNTLNDLQGLIRKGTGKSSVALQSGTSTGTYSFSSGLSSEAIGYVATALGYSTKASGVMSLAVNRGTIAKRDNSTAVGAYNAEESTGLFVVGNGTSDTDRKSAFVVYVDGSAGLQTQGTNDNSVATVKYVKDTMTVRGGLPDASDYNEGSAYILTVTDGAWVLEEVATEVNVEWQES